jgi:hypothetical protein
VRKGGDLRGSVVITLDFNEKIVPFLLVWVVHLFLVFVLELVLVFVLSATGSSVISSPV